MLIQTERLELRPVSNSDLEFKMEMETNPKVMAHIGSGEVRTPEQIADSLKRYLLMAQENPFLGQWVVIEKSTRKNIGTIGLRPPATEKRMDGLEIGFAYIPESWGKGFASEAARGVIDYVHRHFPSKRILAMVAKENAASKKVLNKIGMKLVGETTYVSPVDGGKVKCLLMEWEG